MREKTTSLETKKEICRRRMKFKNFKDEHELQWHLETTKFINGSADDKYLFCETELLATTTVEDEETFELALTPIKHYRGLSDSVELLDVHDVVIESTIDREKSSNMKIYVIAGVILFLLLLFAMAARIVCRPVQPKALRRPSQGHMTKTDRNRISVQSEISEVDPVDVPE
ncbi:hypothetical protein SNEBB_005542 [Seison nebaliae]|nr:hypothetical protein SNEBB_005542 [Seison nebaliae]